MIIVDIYIAYFNKDISINTKYNEYLVYIFEINQLENSNILNWHKINGTKSQTQKMDFISYDDNKHFSIYRCKKTKIGNQLYQ